MPLFVQRLLAAILFAALAILQTSCENSSVATSGNSPDGDRDDLDRPGYETVVLEGTSTEGGNAIVVIGFTTVLDTPDVIWDRISLNLQAARLPVPRECRSDTGPLLTAVEASIGLELVEPERDLRLELHSPAGEAYCAMDFLMPFGPVGLKAVGRYNGGVALELDLTLNGRLRFRPMEESFGWGRDERSVWVAALDLSAFLFNDIISQAALGNDGVLRIGDEATPDLAVEMNRRLVEAFTLYNDLNKSGRVETEERSIANTLGYGSDETTGADSDGDEDFDGPPGEGDREQDALEADPDVMEQDHEDGDADIDSLDQDTSDGEHEPDEDGSGDADLEFDEDGSGDADLELDEDGSGDADLEPDEDGSEDDDRDSADNAGEEDADSEHVDSMTDRHGIVWRWVPAGAFFMGCRMGDGNCANREKPLHRVSFSRGFWMMRTEMTQEKYLQLVDVNPSAASGCGSDCPVENITRLEAQSACAFAGGRLPSEAEWEYAARAGADAVFVCGDDSACLENHAWFNENDAIEDPHSVSGKEPNAWGLYDMSGNVEEWTADCEHTNYVDAPTDGSAWDFDCDPDSGITRGAHYGLSGWSWMRLSFRGVAEADANASVRGFRCVRDEE